MCSYFESITNTLYNSYCYYTLFIIFYDNLTELIQLFDYAY